METGKFWFVIIFVSIVAGIFTGVQHFQGVDVANAQVIETKSKLAQLKDTLVLRQDEWSKVSALASKAQQAITKEAPLTAKREELKIHIRRLEGDFKYMVKSVKDAVEKIRAAGVGVEFPEVKLTNGKVLKAAKIKKLEPMNISFIHADGFTIVTYDELPDDIRERFDMGGNGLAEQLAAAEQTIQTANYSGARSTGKPFKQTKDHIGSPGVQTMEGLTINCPIPLETVEVPPLPGIRQSHVWEGKDGSKGIKITVGVSDGFQGTTFSFDAGAARAIENLEKSGITKLSKSEIDLKISDLPAKKYSISGLSQGQPIFMELVIIVKDLRTYTILAAFFKNPQAREMANAILFSARVQ